MKRPLVYLRAVVVGFALVECGRALYHNRDKLMRSWKRVGGVEGLKGLANNLTFAKVLESVGPLRNLAQQFAHLK